MTEGDRPDAVSVKPVGPAADHEHESSGGHVEVVGFWAFVAPMLWDVGLPTAAYYMARLAGADAYVSLLAGTVAAGGRVGYVAARSRRLDAIAGFLLAVFGVGLVLSWVTGSPRLLLIKDSVPTATAGLIFLGSCLAGRPLAYAWGRRIMAPTPTQQHRWASMWRTEAGFRHVFYTISMAWGCGLLVEALVRIPLVFMLPIDVMAGLSSVLSILTMVSLAGWTVWYSHWVQK